MTWTETTIDLYERIRPTDGFIGTVLNKWAAPNRNFFNIWIEFLNNEFEYEDPFYGLQKSTDPFNMQLSFMDVEAIINIKELPELQNTEMYNDGELILGAFSNSLPFSVPFVKFGKLINNVIEFYMEYKFVNSGNYELGKNHNHNLKSGHFSINLKIRDLIVVQKKNRPIEEMFQYLNPEIYDIKNTKIALDTDFVLPEHDQYRVPYLFSISN